MRVFLSGMEAETSHIFDELERTGQTIPSALMSYYYIKSNPDAFNRCLKLSDEMIIDSGAHSFQEGKRVDWVNYTKEYAQWIKNNDCDKIVGFFEMDVDVVIGYEKVLELREILNDASDKIIPVWHKNRGIAEFKKMCVDTVGNVVAITGFRNEDIKDDQYAMFLKYAHDHGKKVHCLGMTRKKVLDKVPFDYVDSSSWKQTGRFGAIKKFVKGKLVTVDAKGKYKTKELSMINFFEFVKFARYYNQKWNHISHDLYKIWQFVISCLNQKLRSINYYEKSKNSQYC